VALSEYWQTYLRKTAGHYADAIPPYMREQFVNFPRRIARHVFMGEQAPAGRRAGRLSRFARVPKKWLGGGA
jgi:hypothetical protein